jgi:uncharacterized protein with PIN domain
MMRFATDASLGKLGRQLRAAGFDTLCQHEHRHGDFFEIIDSRRVILTRTKTVARRFQGRFLIFIRDNDPQQQMIQVVRELNVEQGRLKPFSRCLACNRLTEPVVREAVKGRVPDYVWQRHATFHACHQCRRIYWAGSHHERMCRRLDAIFQQKKETIHDC